MTRRLAAVTLLGLAMAVFFGGLVLRQLAVASGDPDGRAQTYLWAGVALAVLAVLAAGLLRRPWGVTLGWVVLALTALSALLLPAMIVVALAFAALWVGSLVYGRRMDEMTARWVEEHPAEGSPQSDGD